MAGGNGYVIPPDHPQGNRPMTHVSVIHNTEGWNFITSAFDGTGGYDIYTKGNEVGKFYTSTKKGTMEKNALQIAIEEESVKFVEFRIDKVHLDGWFTVEELKKILSAME